MFSKFVTRKKELKAGVQETRGRKSVRRQAVKAKERQKVGGEENVMLREKRACERSPTRAAEVERNTSSRAMWLVLGTRKPKHVALVCFISEHSRCVYQYSFKFDTSAKSHDYRRGHMHNGRISRRVVVDEGWKGRCV